MLVAVIVVVAGGGEESHIMSVKNSLITGEEQDENEPLYCNTSPIFTIEQ